MSGSSCEYVAEVFRALSHPKRLAIVELLLKGPRAVTEIAESIGVPQPVASQHLRVLRDAGIVESEWGGRQRVYRLSTERVVEPCRLAREIVSVKAEKIGSAVAGAS